MWIAKGIPLRSWFFYLALLRSCGIFCDLLQIRRLAYTRLRF